MRTSEDGWAQSLRGERWLEGVGETADGQRVTVKAVGDSVLLMDISAAVDGVHARRRMSAARTAFADGTADESQIALVACESPNYFSALWRLIDGAIELEWTTDILVDGLFKDATSGDDVDDRAAALHAAVSPPVTRAAAREDCLTLSEAASRFRRSAVALSEARFHYENAGEDATLSLRNRPTDIDALIIGAALNNLLAAALNG